LLLRLNTNIARREIDVTDGAEFMRYANKLSLALLVGLSVAASTQVACADISPGVIRELF
jgi:hypothetical protein